MTSKISFVDLPRQNQLHAQEWQEAINGVIASGRFIGGEEVRSFEKEFAQYVGCREGVGVASGCDALRLSLLAMGVRPGDEVATVSHTFVATADAIVNVGAIPVFVDVDPLTMTMDPEQLRRLMSPKVKVILPVHLYGQSADMDPILEIAAHHGAQVLEDAAQAHGAAYRGRPCGSMGVASCFSFYPAKNLGAFGDGGFVATQDPALAEKLRLLREYGQVEKYRHTLVGYNSRLDALHAAVLRRKLRHLTAWNDARRRAAELYHEHLRNVAGLVLPQEAPGRRHVWHVYGVRTPRRDRLREHLAAKGIESGVHYPIPVHLQPSYANVPFRAGGLARSEEIANQELSLPMFPEIRDDEVAAVAKVLRDSMAGA